MGLAMINLRTQLLSKIANSIRIALFDNDQKSPTQQNQRPHILHQVSFLRFQQTFVTCLSFCNGWILRMGEPVTGRMLPSFAKGALELM
ncbi:hypothetical protein I7I50_10245 [Histoplasma capsulatum G186AR]|uniref:Uncharacterized protein n=1 Tax=Ajellomyces capsulatus TaxID=5037 RepID=A0A8H7Z7C1_AJECA|nr:hypothetical protein I7I52_01484 [Histoplasma capsulatum]QSS69070.1 hypothetical protein I7I50_10245 [Histoplasma capsulatum G186AR]